ncbi:MAG: DUF5672 family protein [Bacteroidota bacterium]
MLKAVVVIPFYKDHLNYDEYFSLDQCFKILTKYDIVAIKPDALDLSFITDRYVFSSVISFDDHYFKTIDGYNQLMLTPPLYQAFLRYEFMLIYQLDAFVFSDQLTHWCNKKYDYIGAPWLRPLEDKNAVSRFILHLKSNFYRRYNITKDGIPNSKQLVKCVGNGGFSLRRVRKFHDLSIKFQGLAEMYISQVESEFNEDIFWSIAINRKKKNLHIPSYRTALKFSIETCPELAYRLNHKRLPFGCHAWDKHFDYWRDKFRELGYGA